MSQFWAWMTRQFKHKWSSSEGDIYDGENLADNFTQWCQELNYFGDKEWSRVFERIQADIMNAAKMGDDIWPPSSIAVVAYAEPAINSKMYRELPDIGIEDLTAKEKRKQTGLSELEKLKALINE